jgi:hypothetical protein
MKLLAYLFAALFLIGVSRAAEWTDTTFRDGTFLDAGSNLYVSAARHRMQIINRWDLNNDGHLDIVLPSGHAHTEKENTYLYLNTGQDIDGRSLIKLPGNGSTDGLVRDLNKDGYNDIAVCNGDNGITTYTDAYVYLGGPDGFSAKRRVVLPAQSSTSIAAGDFDGDGWVDLAIACQWRAGDIVHPTGPATSFIYWNSPDGFSADRRSAFTFDNAGATAVCAGNLDGDKRDDLVMMAGPKAYVYLSPGGRFDGTAKRREFPMPIVPLNAAIGDVNGDGKADLAFCVRDEVLILPALDAEHAIHLPAKTPLDVVLADLNKDGKDDVAIANHAGAEGATWVRSYVYLSDGKTFENVKPIELPTMGAHGISAGDLNGDGFPELVVSNERVTNQHSIPSLVFWNDGHGNFRQGNHTELSTQGCLANAIGDVNHDGRPDVVFFNFEGNFRDGPSTTRIYWGDGTRNFSPQRVTDIATHYITSLAHADLDDDGYVDLVLTQSRFISGAGEDQFNSVIILWGAKDQPFTRSTRLSCDYLAGGVRIADLNRDGWLDLLVGATCSDPADPKKTGMPIFWGSKDGFAQKNKTLIAPAGEYPRCPLIADVNRDGFLDLVSQAKYGLVLTWWGSAKGFENANVSEMKIGREDALVFVDAADLNKDGWLDLILPCRLVGKNAEVSSFVYYGSASGFSADRREELPTIGPYEVSVADFDKDGRLDLFVSSYKGNVKRNWPSSIFWGGDGGLLKRKPTEIPTFAASGVETADYDGDGWIDVFISDHRTDGSSVEPIPHNHRAPSLLYWGGPDGFSPTRRWEAIGNGPHAMNLRDVGNSYDRGLYEDYTSPVHECAPGDVPEKISVKADTPLGTSVQLAVRYAASADAIDKGDWQSVDAAGALHSQADARFMQYRARLMTPNGGPTPYLEGVTVTFAPKH